MSDYQHLGACVVVQRADGLVLMGVRKNGYGAGYYGLPGGRLELGEKVEANAQRELAEETGIFADRLTFLGIVRDAQETYDFIHFVYLYQVEVASPNLVEPDKCEGWVWINPQRLPEHVLRGHRGAIALLLDKSQHIVDYVEPLTNARLIHLDTI